MSEFSKLIDAINSEYSKYKNPNSLIKNVSKEVEMITFAQNCIILIKKDYQSFSQFYDRHYRLEGQINYKSIFNSSRRVVRKLRRFLK